MNTEEMINYSKNMSKEKLVELERVCAVICDSFNTDIKLSRADKEFRESMIGFTEDIKRVTLILDSQDDIIKLLKERAYHIIDSYVEKLVRG